jgi:hypothetical protein
MGKDATIEAAFSDLSLIRRVMSRAEADGMPRTPSALTAGVLSHGILLTVAFGLAIAESVLPSSMTSTMLAAGTDPELGPIGLAFAGAGLATVVACVYFVVWRSARAEGEEFSRFVARNFRYLSNLSLLSDLVSKFACLSLLVLAGKPGWISPLLALFVANYLIEGRCFSLRLGHAIGLGAVGIALSAALFALGSVSLAWPLGYFAVASGLSLATLLRARARLGDRQP